MVTDANTTICWRRWPEAYKAPIRLFKSRLSNPSPEKVVKTMDIVSARSLAGYNVIAATVADRDSARAERLVGDRKFDGKLIIQVVDDSTGQPIEGALVYPSMNVLDEYVVGSPFYSSAAGEGAIPFPTKDTQFVNASVKKEGYRPTAHTWQPAESGTFTFRLVPGGDPKPVVDLDDFEADVVAAPRATTLTVNKNQQEAVQKSIDAAQEAYEKEKREQQERLKKDPHWRPSHEPVAVIKMEEGSQGREINSFCRDRDGNLLVCLAGRSRNTLDALLGAKPADRGSIVKVSPDGRRLGTWKLAMEPQAICLAVDGRIYVGGSGKLCKLDPDGKVLACVDSPATAGLPPLPEYKKRPEPTGPEAEAAEKAKQQGTRRPAEETGRGRAGISKTCRRGRQGLEARR